MANGGRQIPNGDPTQDLLANLLVDQFLAQQDVTRVRDPREERAPQGKLENFLMNLIQGADPSMGLFSGMAGLTPDDPDFKTQIAIGLLTGGSLGSLLRAGGRGLRTAGGAIGRKLDPRPALLDLEDLFMPTRHAARGDAARAAGISTDDAMEELLQEFELFEGLGGKRLPTPQERVDFFQGKLDEVLRQFEDNSTVQGFNARGIARERLENATARLRADVPETIQDIERLLNPTGVARTQEETLGNLLDRIGRGGREGAEEVRGIRQQIFDDLVRAEERGGGFKEADKLRTSVLEQIEELTRRRN